MKTENLTIANLSCDGCVNTITKKLSAISGVEKVEVDLKTNSVTVNHNELVSKEQISQMLLSIGYPEATEKNGLLTQLKSVTSCLTGKFSN
jgi:copper chaperone CopZ